MVDNSQSVASCSDDGAVHVWRVDTKSMNSSSNGMASLRVTGSTEIRTLDVAEGPVVRVSHFNAGMCSMLAYASVRGGVHGWDLRAASEAFFLPSRHELGYLTTFAVASDRSWLCTGTSKGYVGIWDLRMNVLGKLWKLAENKMIHRITCGPALSGGDNCSVLISAGTSEVGIWSFPEGGHCSTCFRVLPISSADVGLGSLPFLEDVPLPNHSKDYLRVVSENFENSFSDSDHSIRALVPRFSPNGLINVITGGTDKKIRFWDVTAPSKCYTLSGLDPGQQKPTYKSLSVDPGGSITVRKVFACLEADPPRAEVLFQVHRPLREVSLSWNLPNCSYVNRLRFFSQIDYSREEVRCLPSTVSRYCTYYAPSISS